MPYLDYGMGNNQPLQPDKDKLLQGLGGFQPPQDSGFSAPGMAQGTPSQDFQPQIFQPVDNSAINTGFNNYSPSPAVGVSPTQPSFSPPPVQQPMNQAQVPSMSQPGMASIGPSPNIQQKLLSPQPPPTMTPPNNPVKPNVGFKPNPGFNSAPPNQMRQPMNKPPMVRPPHGFSPRNGY